MEELFTQLTRIIAHPHTAITDHDRIRAAKAILEVSDFYLGYRTDDAPDLYRYAIELLGELEGHDKIDRTRA
jgi:hypothetical protein